MFLNYGQTYIKRPHRRSKLAQAAYYQSGFSLIEYLLVLVLTASIAVMGMSTWVGYAKRKALLIALGQVFSLVHLAREVALQHHASILLCGSGDGLHCDGRWHQGQLLKIMPQGRLLSRMPGFPAYIQIQYRGGFGRNSIVFDRMGFAPGSQGRFILRIKGLLLQRQLILSASGRLRHAIIPRYG
jgi:type IV fimbrial biogenesis protein FimT